eukprot:2460605-Pleurochrysis_carterae.AAC.1
MRARLHAVRTNHILNGLPVIDASDISSQLQCLPAALQALDDARDNLPDHLAEHDEERNDEPARACVPASTPRRRPSIKGDRIAVYWTDDAT